MKVYREPWTTDSAIKGGQVDEALEGRLMTPPRGAATNQARAALRTMIDGEVLIRRIEAVTQELMSGEYDVRDQATGLRVALPMDTTRISALNSVLGAQFRLLNKVLPDLRSVELSTTETTQLTAHEQPDRLVLATKLLAMMREAQAGATVEAVGEPTPDAERPSWAC